MKVTISYRTDYEYSREVAFSPHVFRIFPRLESHLTTVGQMFATTPDADVHQRRDLFDNCVAACYYRGKRSRLTAELELKLRLDERNPFAFLLAPHAVEIPFRYRADEERILAPFLRAESGSATLPFWNAPAAPEPTVPALAGMTRAVYENIGYERRDEGAARSLEETLRIGQGACRDFAVLQVQALRHLQIAARLASGYLCHSGEGENRAEGSLHAWVEAYLPGAGWLGLDPTNGILCDHHYVTCAVGYGPEDISPIVGSYYSNETVESKMSADLQIVLS